LFRPESARENSEQKGGAGVVPGSSRDPEGPSKERSAMGMPRTAGDRPAPVTAAGSRRRGRGLLKRGVPLHGFHHFSERRQARKRKQLVERVDRVIGLDPLKFLPQSFFPSHVLFRPVGHAYEDIP